MVDHDDNIFDEDDALDYIMYEEVEKEVNDTEGGSGCLGVVMILAVPVLLADWLFCYVV